MTEALRQWLLGIVGASAFCAAAEQITPKGAVKSVQRAVCGMVTALALVSPLLKLDFASYAEHLSAYRVEAETLTADADEIAAKLSRTIIAEELRAYILDKAASLGAEVTAAEVTLHWSDEGVWYPTEVKIDGEYSAALADVIEAELGVGAAGQHWSANEDD
ncbi:MAG: stage III sporulation protein AF [Oscillospiraceae bacterium]|nr:stage III sporulation protein AF [Oscillospiraceae bacterium]